MKNTLRIISFVLLVILVFPMAMSCGVEYTDEEVIKAAKTLMEKSYSLNDIYFGEGLPISEADSEEAKKFAQENGFDLENVQFLPVTVDSPYKSVNAIKKATEKVYSAEYCEYLYQMAFEGFSTEDGSAAVYAKYMEDEAGTLTARIDLADNPLPERTYDYDSIKVKSKEKDKAVISVDSYLDGKKEESPVRLTLVKEEKGWRLDTPTY